MPTWLELSPFIQSGYLISAVGVVGGRTFRTLRDFFNNSSRIIAGSEMDPEVLYDRLVGLAAKVPEGARWT